MRTLLRARPVPLAAAGLLCLTSVALSPAAHAAEASRAPAAATACAPRISAQVDTELTERFGAYGDTAGRWTGADSAYSVPLPDGSIAWIYSDTFLGEVDADHGRPLDSPFLHNSIVVDDDGVLTTHTGGTAEAPGSLVTVPGGDELRDDLVRLQPAGRLGTPRDIAGLVCFLVSDAGEWVNGQLLHCDGGAPLGELPV